jgi:hypothetical protein
VLTPYSDSLSLRLRRSRLNLAAHHNSPVHYPRSTPSPGSCDHWAPTGCRHTVSGTISLPFRGAFHLSLTVLVHYRSLRVFSLRGWSPWIHARYHVPGATWERFGRSQSFAYGAITLCGSTFQPYSAGPRFCDSHMNLPATPRPPQEPRFRLFPVRSPLLGESLLIYFPRATKMFQFARLPPTALYIQTVVTQHYLCRVAPFGYLRVQACLQLAGAVSLLATPFIGSQCQGIHHAPFVA